MKTRVLIPIGLLFLLGGCAIPFALEIASYIKLAGDVGSYIETEKSLTDHVVSSFKKEDCAFHRVFFGEDVCVPTEDSEEMEDENYTEFSVDWKALEESRI